MRVVAPDGTELIAEADGSGPPVVFVHGSNGGLDSWADIGALITGHRIVRYARRNYAPSAHGPNGFGVEAGDLLAVLAAVGEPAHVVGGSYGATVALHAAIDTDRIASLALFEPPLLNSGPHLLPVLEEYRNLCAAARFADALTLFLREAAQMPAEILDGADMPDDRDAALSAGADLEAMAHDTADVGRWAAVTVPVLLLGGDLSWSPLREGMVALESVLPHARRVSWADQSHFAIGTEPDLVAGEIQRFLDAPT
jgi:pimeloyl-ACP methyl ester carboxylesterase